MDGQEKLAHVAACLDRALAAAEEARKAFQEAGKIGRTARVLNPHNRLGMGLNDACAELQGSRDELATLVEAMRIEGQTAAR